MDAWERLENEGVLADSLIDSMWEKFYKDDSQMVCRLEGSQLGALCPLYAKLYCYLEFNLVWKPDFFLIKSKRIIWSYMFALKSGSFLLCLKAFSWETDFLVTLGDFTVKRKL